MRSKAKGKSLAPWEFYYRGDLPDLPLDKVTKRHKKDANRQKSHLEKHLDKKGGTYGPDDNTTR